MAEREAELKNLLMTVKEESERASLKLNIKKNKIMASGSMLLVCALRAQLCLTLCDPLDSLSM